jgi:hypothetical protein
VVQKIPEQAFDLAMIRAQLLRKLDQEEQLSQEHQGGTPSGSPRAGAKLPEQKETTPKFAPEQIEEQKVVDFYCWLFYYFFIYLYSAQAVCDNQTIVSSGDGPKRRASRHWWG